MFGEQDIELFKVIGQIGFSCFAGLDIGPDFATRSFNSWDAASAFPSARAKRQGNVSGNEGNEKNPFHKKQRLFGGGKIFFRFRFCLIKFSP